VIVRDIEPGDHNAWRRLFVDYGVFYETAFTDDVLDGVWAWLLDSTHEVNAVVAVDGGEIAGFAHYRRLFDTFTAGPGWFLDDLYVSPGARSGGIGTALIEAVTERARVGGGGTLRWITAADNDRAQRVYDRIATRATWVTFEREID
jgi:ribosomal protein S18 acetylase RimI-like enzyme